MSTSQEAALGLLLVALTTWFSVRLPQVQEEMLHVATHPETILASDLPIYAAMADALLHHGRLGYFDTSRVAPLGDLAALRADLESLHSSSPVRRWEWMSYND